MDKERRFHETLQSNKQMCVFVWVHKKDGHARHIVIQQVRKHHNKLQISSILTVIYLQ